MINIALKAAEEAGKVMMENFSKVKEIKRKSSDKSGIFTEIDLKSEKTIIDIIKNSFPDHAIVSEESNPDFVKEKYVWIIDPIDGTINYISGNPYFCVSIALQKNQETILGVVFNPATKDLFIAEKGRGAIFNGEKVKVSETKSISDANVCFDWDHYKEENIEKIKNIIFVLGERTRKMYSRGAGALDISFVATGIFDAFITHQANPWDIAAAALIVKEAGGKVTTIDNKEIKGLQNSILATNGRIHKEILEILSIR